MSGWLTIMAVLSLLAFGLHAAGADTVAGFLSLASAVCTVPVVALGVAEGRRLRAADPTCTSDRLCRFTPAAGPGA